MAEGAASSPISGRLSKSLADIVDQYVAKTGRNKSDLINEALQQYFENGIIEETSLISKELANAFRSDIEKLDNALEVIRGVYVAQMTGLKAQLDSLSQRYEKQIEDLKAAHITKAAELMVKIDALQEALTAETNAKHTAEQAQKDAEHAAEIKQRDIDNARIQIENQTETIRVRDERIAELTEQVVRLNSEVGKSAEVREENEQLRRQASDQAEEIRAFRASVDSLEARLAEGKATHEAELERAHMQLELEKERAIASKEAEVQTRIADRFDQYQQRLDATRDQLDAERQRNAELLTQLRQAQERIEALEK